MVYSKILLTHEVDVSPLIDCGAVLEGDTLILPDGWFSKPNKQVSYIYNAEGDLYGHIAWFADTYAKDDTRKLVVYKTD